jgi:hypothetical protein
MPACSRSRPCRPRHVPSERAKGFSMMSRARSDAWAAGLLIVERWRGTVESLPISRRDGAVGGGHQCRPSRSSGPERAGMRRGRPGAGAAGAPPGPGSAAVQPGEHPSLVDVHRAPSMPGLEEHGRCEVLRQRPVGRATKAEVVDGLAVAAEQDDEGVRIPLRGRVPRARRLPLPSPDPMPAGDSGVPAAAKDGTIPPVGLGGLDAGRGGFVLPFGRVPAGVAQSAEHGHGKSGVAGSIPASSSRWPRRRVGGVRLRSLHWSAGGGVAQRQSKRLIIAVSVVRFHPPLRIRLLGPRPMDGRDGPARRQDGDGEVREPPEDHDGLHRVQAPELHHGEEPPERSRADRASQVLPVVPRTHRPPRDPLTLEPEGPLTRRPPSLRADRNPLRWAQGPTHGAVRMLGVPAR